MNNILQLIQHQEVKKVSQKMTPFFKNFPHLPKSFRNFLVEIIPYLLFVSAILLIISSFGSLLGARWFTPFHFMRSFVFLQSLRSILQIVVAIIFFASFDALLKKEEVAWYALFVTSAISLLGNIFTLFWGGLSLITLIFSLALNLYLLYEIKDHYFYPAKNEAKAVKKKVNVTAKTTGSQKSKVSQKKNSPKKS